jgi:hypothetical protein
MAGDLTMNPRPIKTDQQRLPKKARAKKPPVFRITDRDVLLLKAACKHRYLTVDQIAWLFPDSSSRGLENRLRYLFHNKYLNRVILHESVSHKLIYTMTEKAARLIAERDSISRQDVPWQRHLNQVSMSHIQHLLSVNDVVISFQSALVEKLKQRAISQYKVIPGDPDLHKISATFLNQDGARYKSSVIPDAVVGILFPNRELGLFFVEVDRATMTINRWESKVAVYHEYSRNPELRERFHTGWFIVLTITTSDKRILSLSERTVLLGGKRAFWYTTADKIEPGSVLSRIWVRASDLFQLRNERTELLTDIRTASRTSILDTIGG